MGSLSPHPAHFQRPSFQLIPDPDSKSEVLHDIRSLPELVHFNALRNPHHVFCLQSKQSPDATRFEFATITFQQLGQAVEQCCLWILANIKGAHTPVPGDGGVMYKSSPVALFLESDVSLFVYMTALLSLNIPCLLLSIRLNPNAVQQLLEETAAFSIIVSSRTAAVINDSFSRKGDSANLFTSWAIAAPFEDLLATSSECQNLHHIFSSRQFVKETDQNVLILHSSGTTGRPKAIPLSHRYLLGYAACHLFPASEDESERGVNLSTLPLFHGFGVLAPCLALSVGKAFCLPPSTTICNGSLVLRLLNSREFTSLMTVPTILEDIVLMEAYESAAAELARLDFVVVGGGGIKASVGTALRANGVALLNHFGATELGALAPIFRPDKSYDWRYLKLRKDMDLQLKRLEASDDSDGAYMLIGHQFGSNSAFELQDSLAVNPLKPETEVRILGRKDDLIVLATGEKVSPNAMENKMEQNPLIKRAIMFGTGQFEVGVFIEPVPNVVGQESVFIDKIWPAVIEANKIGDQQACISSKAAVLVKPADREVPLSDKGLPQRKEVYSVFHREIQLVYDRLEKEGPSSAAIAIDPNNPEKSVRAMVQLCLPPHNTPDGWNNDDDFVQLGMDSLQATRLRRILVQSLRHSDAAGRYLHAVPVDFVYSNPTISKMARALQPSAKPDDYDPVDLMRTLSHRYSFQDEGWSHSHKIVVLLTGTTGNLGCHLLRVLSEHRHVYRLICLIRAPPNIQSADFDKFAVDRQKRCLKDRGIILPESSWLKIRYQQWDAGAELLGMNRESYNEVAKEITHIFHGAWPMNFQSKLSSFGSQIKAFRDLVDLARVAHQNRPTLRPRIILASSIAVVGRDPSITSSRLIPELPMDDPRSPLSIGYAEAKWVCEQIMASAFNNLQSEMLPMIVRIGQLSGSSDTGYWSHKEHIPAIVKSSIAIRHLPDLHGSLSWLQVDRAAQVVMELLLRSEPRNLVYHLENPVRQSWADICSILERKINLPPSSRLPFKEWLARVSTNENHPTDLMEFYSKYFLNMSGGGLVLDTTNCRALSPTLRSTGAIRPDEIELYLDFWHGKGFLN